MLALKLFKQKEFENLDPKLLECFSEWSRAKTSKLFESPKQEWISVEV